MVSLLEKCFFFFNSSEHIRIGQRRTLDHEGLKGKTARSTTKND